MWDVCQTAAFEDWWRELSEQEQDDLTAVVEFLAEMGRWLPFPYSSGVEGSRHSHMRETRSTTNTSTASTPNSSHDPLLL
jgi:hypothetical protein